MTEKPQRREKPPGLWVTDAELIRRSGVPEKIMRDRLKFFDADPKSTFPRKKEEYANRRYWPAVQGWMEKTDITAKPAKTPARRMMDVPGKVYIIGTSTHIKIGFAYRGARKRIAEIQAYHPERLEVLAIIHRATMVVERHLQKKFAAHRANGEWFKRVPEIEEFARTQMNDHWRKDLPVE